MGAREDLICYLHKQLVGPAGEDHELIEAPPDRRYLMGTLYPQDTNREQRLTESAEVLGASVVSEEISEESRFAAELLPEANDWLPSSLGLSFFTDATKLRLTCRAACYVTLRGDGSRRWRREPLPDACLTAEAGQTELVVFDGRGEIQLRWRPFPGGQLVTVALVNTARSADDEPGAKRETQWDDMLFQVSLEVEPVDGELREYPSVRLTSRDKEEEELRLQYRHVVTYGIGHSCAVEEIRKGDRVAGLRTEVMPEVEVPAIRPAGPTGSPVLKLSHLYDPELSVEQLRAELREFTGGYRAWYEEQLRSHVPPWGKAAARRILARVGTSVERMEAGVEALCSDPSGKALGAFRVANHAMALQMQHSREDLAGRRRARSDAVPLDPGPLATATWHPFQLGFFLLVAQSVIEESHPDRNVVDLIWFPTGGGKTEAYLFLACFEMVLRRLRYGAEGGGTAVISRYTLSLLTTQQFQRASTTICALEYLRGERQRAGSSEIPGEAFTIGLWVGDNTSPNRYETAHRLFQQQRNATHPQEVFILDRCPWCGTRILPAAKSPDNSDYGVRASYTSFEFFCPRDDCYFHEGLPVAVVDEHIYESPPTFLLGTVDKFARLAWETRAGSLFGGAGKRPPSLVIQDELHLLSGPLGTTVGLYESAVLQLCSRDDGPAPKVVASTATIRRAGEQVRQLYGRDVQLFPSAGLDARYSYFAEPDGTRPGRKYVGVMAQGHTAGRATAVTAAAMLQGPMELPEEHRDDYWTLIAYHHSMRELGRTLTAASDDIPAQLAALGSPGRRRELKERQVQELSSNLERAEQPKVLDRLERDWRNEDSVSFVPCTNMLSVGVDVRRLALMLMLGQPKATAEYIQATSRVGRHAVPGLVVTFLNATRPRDRSHYETFGTFHRSLYRHVEPTSVTPWSIPSRRRALHAALVILARHGIGLYAENQAGDILDHEAELADAVSSLIDWVARCDPSAMSATEKDLAALLREWREEAEQARKEDKYLYYRPAGKGQHSLLKNFDRPGGLWVTQHSMRNVDRDCQMIVKGAGR